MIEFYSVTTLPTVWRNHIQNEMSWDDGAMILFLKHNIKKCKLALNFQRRKLVCWSAISALTWERNKKSCAMAWTLKKHRGKGYAKETIRGLLEHFNFSTEMNVYKQSMCYILRQLGCIPIYQKWDEKKMKTWIKRCGF